jgi:hypothetical protein
VRGARRRFGFLLPQAEIGRPSRSAAASHVPQQEDAPARHRDPDVFRCGLLSSRGDNAIVPGARDNVQIDRPEAVNEAIRRMSIMVR